MGSAHDGGAAPRTPKPGWLKVRMPQGERFRELERLVREERLNTVCRDARCPNIGECWGAGTATFMILGEVCTRSCRFCAVKKGRPPVYDPDEPRRVAHAVLKLGLRFVVVTSVDRDDLDDGGAHIFAETVRRIRALGGDIGIEVLIPDFRGDESALRAVVDAGPDILGHNIETVARLYPMARSGASYARSLRLLRKAKGTDGRPTTKSGIMLGLGETRDEILEAMHDLAEAGVDILTLGQYLQPTREHLPVARYYAPEEFAELREYGLALGFRHVAAGPLVRSSYHAEKQAAELRRIT